MKEISAELGRLRLERDMTYKALGQELGLSERTVYRILNFPEQRPHERTEFKIRQYLASVAVEKPVTKRNARKSRAA